MWSVEAVLSHIRDAGTSWRAERLQPVADLRFTYEQEPSPEEFFTPYIWSVVYERAAVGWDPARIVLFQVRPPTADDEAAAAAGGRRRPRDSAPSTSTRGRPAATDGVARGLTRRLPDTHDIWRLTSAISRPMGEMHVALVS